MEEFNIKSNKLQKLISLKQLLQKGVEYIPNTSVKIYRTKKLNNGSRVTGSAI